jgi:hypothetical protein
MKIKMASLWVGHFSELVVVDRDKGEVIPEPEADELETYRRQPERLFLGMFGLGRLL